MKISYQNNFDFLKNKFHFQDLKINHKNIVYLSLVTSDLTNSISLFDLNVNNCFVRRIYSSIKQNKNAFYLYTKQKQKMFIRIE
jgi:hypothetical protein